MPFNDEDGALVNWQTTEDDPRSEQMREVQDALNEIINRAEEILQNRDKIFHRADSYWLSSLKVESGLPHNYLASSMCTIEDTINELEEQEEKEQCNENEEEEDSDENCTNNSTSTDG